MDKRYITPAMVELRAAIQEAETLTAKPEMTKRDEQRINVLLAKIAALKTGAVAPDDSTQRWMRSFLRGEENLPELRNDFLAGSQTITYTVNTLGGTIVPQEFHNEIILGLSQNDPLLNKDVVTLSESKGTSLRPYTVPGWDLTNFAATKVAEGAQQNPGTVPPAVNKTLGGYIYKATLDASFEFEDDDFQPLYEQLKIAYAQAFAKGVGQDLISGDGTTGPQGLLNFVTNSGITTSTAGGVTIQATDIDNIYFAVDEAYRTSPKCGWVMSDTVYKNVRQAVDVNQRSLISIVDGREVLIGKPVYICPSMPSAPGTKGFIFGDLSHLVVRVSRMAITRNMQAAGYVEKGKGLYTARMRADAKLIDPTNGSKPPIIYATLHV